MTTVARITGTGNKPWSRVGTIIEPKLEEPEPWAYCPI